MSDVSANVRVKRRLVHDCYFVVFNSECDVMVGPWKVSFKKQKRKRKQTKTQTNKKKHTLQLEWPKTCFTKDCISLVTTSDRCVEGDGFDFCQRFRFILYSVLASFPPFLFFTLTHNKLTFRRVGTLLVDPPTQSSASTWKPKNGRHFPPWTPIAAAVLLYPWAISWW